MKVTLKDGSVKEYAQPMAVIDIAKDISEGLARMACVAEINGEEADLRTVVDSDCQLNILTAKDAEGLAALRHTASHVMAQAIKRLWPDTKLAIGPSIAKECFEVDAPCAEEFLALPDSDKFVTNDGNGKFHVDLWACNRAFLLGAGVLPEHITTGGVCTMCNSDLLFSHRVTRGKRGSNAGFLMLREQNA